MDDFLGKFIEEKCICGEMVKTEYGCGTPLYQDENGNEFDCNPNANYNRCPNCGHLINSERVANAKFIGYCCY